MSSEKRTKPRPSRKPKVEMYDHVLRWAVGSRSNPEIEHIVDLGNPEMQCSCKDHIFRKRRCHHIKVAREALCDLLIEELKDGT
jgi:hypothetical protein